MIVVKMALSPDTSLVPVVQALTGQLAEQLALVEESERESLAGGVGAVCRRVMEKHAQGSGDVRVEFRGSPERLEVEVVAGLRIEAAGAKDRPWSVPGVDQVRVEDTEGSGSRITLVKRSVKGSTKRES